MRMMMRRTFVDQNYIEENIDLWLAARYICIYLDATITTITSWDVGTLAVPDVLCESHEFLLNLGLLMNLRQLVKLILKF